MAIFYAVLFTLLLIGVWVGTAMWRKWGLENLPVGGYDVFKQGEQLVVVWVLRGILTSILSLGTCINLERAIKIYLAPRLYVLEWLRSLL